MENADPEVRESILKTLRLSLMKSIVKGEE